MSKLKKALVVGSLVGAGLAWLTSTKKGKETRDKMLDVAADISVQVSKKFKKLEKQYHSSQKMYVKLVQDTVKEYFAKHPSLSLAQSIIVKMVEAQWDNIKEEVSGKANETKKAAKRAFGKTTKK